MINKVSIIVKQNVAYLAAELSSRINLQTVYTIVYRASDELPGNELHYVGTLCHSNATLSVRVCVPSRQSMLLSHSLSASNSIGSRPTMPPLLLLVAGIVWLLQFCVILFAYFVSGLNINAATRTTTTTAARTAWFVEAGHKPLRNQAEWPLLLMISLVLPAAIIVALP